MSDRNSNYGTFPREPGASERQARDVLDDIEEAVARIPDKDIEDRLCETLRLAGYGPHANPRPDTSTTSPGLSTGHPDDATWARTQPPHACAAWEEA
jgi:hypothetical protein